MSVKPNTQVFSRYIFGDRLLVEEVSITVKQALTSYVSRETPHHQLLPIHEHLKFGK